MLYRNTRLKMTVLPGSGTSCERAGVREGRVTRRLWGKIQWQAGTHGTEAGSSNVTNQMWRRQHHCGRPCRSSTHARCVLFPLFVGRWRRQRSSTHELYLLVAAAVNDTDNLIPHTGIATRFPRLICSCKHEHREYTDIVLCHSITMCYIRRANKNSLNLIDTPRSIRTVIFIFLMLPQCYTAHSHYLLTTVKWNSGSPVQGTVQPYPWW